MTTLTWIARLSGGLIALLIAGFALAQTPEPHFVVGMIALYGGLVAAWRYPLIGGLTTIAGWLLTGVSWDVPFVLPAAIGLLHIATFRHKPASTPRPPTWLAATAAVVALLLANEMFGMPPLMTPPLRGLTGTWSSAAATITIHPDHSVSGIIDGSPITTGRATRNRSPFGQLIGWRTDYLLQGSVHGKRFTAPLNADGSNLRGSLANRSVYLTKEN